MRWKQSLLALSHQFLSPMYMNGQTWTLYFASFIHTEALRLVTLSHSVHVLTPLGSFLMHGVASTPSEAQLESSVQNTHVYVVTIAMHNSQGKKCLIQGYLVDTWQLEENLLSEDISMSNWLHSPFSPHCFSWQLHNKWLHKFYSNTENIFLDNLDSPIVFRNLF